jgi:hypothetical protein
MLESLFYFAVTILILGSVFAAYLKLRRWRRSMRIVGWLALTVLHAIAIWMICRLAVVRLELPAATAWLGSEPPWYYRPTVICGAFIPIIGLLAVATVCVRRAIYEIRENA